MKEVKVTNIEKYLFADDKKKVKVYVEMEGVGAFKVACPPECDPWQRPGSDPPLSSVWPWTGHDRLHI